RRDVVRLTRAAVQQETGRGVDQSAVRTAVLLCLRAPVHTRGTRNRERSAQVDAHDVVPLVVGQVEHHARTPEAGVVDDDVETAPRGERALDQRVAGRGFGDVTPVGHGRAAVALDLPYDVGRRILVGRRAIGRDARVVHDHTRAVRREAPGVRAADTAAG